jgi:MYXO-CTERM domain-containing protein
VSGPVFAAVPGARLALVAGLAFAAAAPVASACSPPRLVDIGMQRLDPVDQPAWAGSSGELTLQVDYRAGVAPVQFIIHHGLDPLPFGPDQSVRLESLPQSQCFLTEYVGPGPLFGDYGLYYTLHGEVDPIAAPTAYCRLRYEVLPTGRTPAGIRLMVVPTPCAADPDFSDNQVLLQIGGQPPAAPVPGITTTGWLVLVAGVLLAGAVRRRHSGSRSASIG